MKTVPLSTTYDGAVLSGEIEVLQGGVCVRMSAPYPGLLRRRMMRTSPLQSEAQCELTGRTLLEQLYVEARGIVDHREAYERVAAIAQTRSGKGKSFGPAAWHTPRCGGVYSNLNIL